MPTTTTAKALTQSSRGAEEFSLLCLDVWTLSWTMKTVASSNRP
jgi:hypothetical protein